MSKLIVDDIELASGSYFSIPDTIEQNKIIKVTAGSISAFEDLPQPTIKVIHDFRDGTPSTITHTFSQDSDNIVGLYIYFENINMRSPNNDDLTYRFYDATNTANTTYTTRNYTYMGSAYQSNNVVGNTTPGGTRQTGYWHMGGGNAVKTQFAASTTNTVIQNRFESHEHFVSFHKSTLSGTQRTHIKQTGRHLVSGQSGPTSYTTGSSVDSNSALNNINYVDFSSNPITKIEFQTANLTMRSGRIKILEIPK